MLLFSKSFDHLTGIGMCQCAAQNHRQPGSRTDSFSGVSLAYPEADIWFIHADTGKYHDIHADTGIY